MCTAKCAEAREGVKDRSGSAQRRFSHHAANLPLFPAHPMIQCVPIGRGEGRVANWNSTIWRCVCRLPILAPCLMREHIDHAVLSLGERDLASGTVPVPARSVSVFRRTLHSACTFLLRCLVHATRNKPFLPSNRSVFLDYDPLFSTQPSFFFFLLSAFPFLDTKFNLMGIFTTWIPVQVGERCISVFIIEIKVKKYILDTFLELYIYSVDTPYI